MGTYLQPGSGPASGSHAAIRKTSYCVVQSIQTREFPLLIFIGYFKTKGRSEVVLGIDLSIFSTSPGIHQVTLTYISLPRRLPSINHTLLPRPSSAPSFLKSLGNNIYFVNKWNGDCPDEISKGLFNISYKKQGQVAPLILHEIRLFRVCAESAEKQNLIDACVWRTCHWFIVSPAIL